MTTTNGGGGGVRRPPPDGDGEFSRTEQPTTRELWAMSRSIDEVEAIDTLLSDRIPTPASEPRPDSNTPVRLTPVAVAKHNAPPRLLGDSLGPMTDGEVIRLHTDVFGRTPPEAEKTDSRVSALEREIGRIPAAKRRALDKALRRHPLLMIASPHTKMLLEDEHFDPVSAARRLANYWEQREAMFGKKAYSAGVFVDPAYDDYIRFYDKCERGKDDPEMDIDMRDLARDYVLCVNEVKIASLDRIIDSASDRDKAALLEARQHCPDVAGSEEHKLLFLKSEDFIEAKAAVRMMKYWATKRLLFGPEAFRRKIRLEDVQNSVYNGDYEGMFRLMPETDESGRSILVIVVSEMARTGWTKEGMSQFLWCVLHIALSRPSCRRNGIVILADYQMGNAEMYSHISPARQLFRLVLFESIPIKIRGIHCFFVPSGWWDGFMMSVVSAVSNVIKKRIVFHLGINEHNLKTLEDRFGVHRNQVPVELGGEMDLELWKAWIQENMANELW